MLGSFMPVSGLKLPKLCGEASQYKTNVKTSSRKESQRRSRKLRKRKVGLRVHVTARQQIGSEQHEEGGV